MNWPNEADLNYIYLCLGTVAAFAQIITLFFVAKYVLDTRTMARATQEATQTSARVLQEMQASRDQETAPYVVVYFDQPYGEWHIYLIVKNIGKSLAENVHLEFQPPLQNSTGAQMGSIPLITQGVPSLPPEHEIRIYVGITTEYWQNHLPEIYEVNVSYLGGLSPALRHAKYILNLAVYHGLETTAVQNMGDLVQSVDKLTNVIVRLYDKVREISNTLANGIWLKNPDTLISNMPVMTDSGTSTLQAKLFELKLLWAANYGQHNTKSTDLDVTDFKAKCYYIATQLVVITSHMQWDSSKELMPLVGALIDKLLEFHRSGITLYRGMWGSDLALFTTFQSAIVDLIDHILAQIELQDHALDTLR